jgi:nucleoside-diphosphate-sugar epimerase
MNVFVAGATGAIGQRLVPLLVARGHDVVAMSRRGGGEHGVAVEAFDRTAVIQAVMRAEPDVVVHELSGLAGTTSLRNFDRAFALTNRLRTEGTDNLLEASRRASVRRFVAQSFGNWNYERTGTAVKTEQDPLDPNPVSTQRESLAAIRHVEAAALDGGVPEGLALRYGNLYGRGTGLTDAAYVEAIRKRRLPIIGNGAGMWSLIHVDDAAAATVAAVEHGAPGIYNVVDDEPAPAGVVLRALAEALGARPPRRVPAWLGRLLAGEALTSMFTQIRGASNAKARRELGWQPGFPSWRQGFELGLAPAPVDPPSVATLIGVPERAAR